MKKKELKWRIETLELRANNPLYDNKDLSLLFKRVSNLELDKKLTQEAKGDAPEMELRKQIEALILEFSDANFFLTNTEIVKRLKEILSTTQEEAPRKVEIETFKIKGDIDLSTLQGLGGEIPEEYLPKKVGIDFSKLTEFTSFDVPKWCKGEPTPEEPNYKEMYEKLKEDLENLHKHYGGMRAGEEIKSRIFWRQLGRILSENNLEKDE